LCFQYSSLKVPGPHFVVNFTVVINRNDYQERDFAGPNSL
jgi:hypothetical protein